MKGFMTTHQLKTWPEFFEKVWVGEKTFEVRKDDRDFQVGDTLDLAEWNPQTKQLTGRNMCVRVSYILRDPQYCK